MVGWSSLGLVSVVDELEERARIEGSVYFQLARITDKLDTVIDQHGKAIDESRVLHNSADDKLTTNTLQLNNHETRLSSLELKTSGLFNRAWTITTGCVSLIALMFTWLKMGNTP